MKRITLAKTPKGVRIELGSDNETTFPIELPPHALGKLVAMLQRIPQVTSYHGNLYLDHNGDVITNEQVEQSILKV